MEHIISSVQQLFRTLDPSKSVAYGAEDQTVMPILPYDDLLARNMRDPRIRTVLVHD